LRRGTRGRINSEDKCIIKGLKCFQYARNRRWRKIEKVNLACCEGGIQEVAGRAVIIVPCSFFSMKKVDK
jgi:hypothetical protein